MHKYDEYRKILKEELKKYEKLSKSSLRKLIAGTIAFFVLITLITFCIVYSMTRNIITSATISISLTALLSYTFYKWSMNKNGFKNGTDAADALENNSLYRTAAESVVSFGGFFGKMVDEAIKGVQYSKYYSQLLKKSIGADFLELAIESAAKILCIELIITKSSNPNQVLQYDIGNGFSQETDEILMDGLNRFLNNIQDIKEREFLVTGYDEKLTCPTKEEFDSKKDYFKHGLFSDEFEKTYKNVIENDDMFVFYAVCETVISSAIKKRLNIA